MSVREDICKALEYCADNKFNCRKCPYDSKGLDCANQLLLDARALLMGEDKPDPDKDSLGMIVALLTDIRDALKN